MRVRILLLSAVLVPGCCTPPPPTIPPVPPPPCPTLVDPPCLAEQVFAPLPAEYTEDIYASPPAPAQVYDPDDPVEAARELFKVGLKAQKEDQWDAARRAFLDGWKNVKTPHIAFRLAETAMHLDHPSDVLYYTAFVLLSTDPKIGNDQREQALRWRAEAQPRVGGLEVDGEQGACLTVDGLAAGPLPLAAALVLDPGRHRVGVRHRGKQAGEDATVTAAKVTKITVALQ